MQRSNSMGYSLLQSYSALSARRRLALRFAPFIGYALGFEMKFGPRFPVDLAMVVALNVVVAVLIYCGIMLWDLLGA